MAFSLPPLRRAALLVALSFPASFPSLIHAQTASASASQTWSLPPGTLAETLALIARQANRGLIANPDLVRGKQAPAVRGTYTPDEAMQQALSGSGLEAYAAGGGWSLRPRGATSTGATGSTAPAAVATLDDVTVTAVAEMPAYLADRPSSLALKTDMLPRLTPFSVDQVTAEMMQERGDTNIFATLEGFAGLTTNSSNSDAGGGHSRAIQIRGFSNGQTLINGIPSYSDQAGTIRGTDSLESVELLRGPAGLYYGAAEPGGVIAYNYKRPRDVAGYVLRGDTDSRGSYGGMADATGPLNKEGTLLYRLVGSYKHRKDDQDHIFSQPASVLAALSFRPHRAFSSTLTYERMDMKSVPEQENNFRITSGRLAGQYYPVPKEFFWGSLNDRVERNTDTFLWDATYSETEAFKVRAGLTYQQYDQFWQNTRARNPANGPNAAGNVARYVSGRQSDGESMSGSLDFSGVLRTGAWRNDWLVGVGYGNSKGASSGRQVAGESISGSGRYPVDFINVFNPVYTDYAYGDRIWADPLVKTAERTDKNVYLQDMLYLPGGRTRFLLGMGWTEYRSDPLNGASTKLSKWSPRVAAMQDITDSTTVYASYGESFVPQGSLSYLDTAGNYITKPVDGTQYEVGLKQDLFDGKALFTAALFRVDKKNVATLIDNLECAPGAPAVPSLTPNDLCYEVSGLTRAQGLELRLSGQVLEGWVAQLGYSYTDTEYKRNDSPARQGRSVEYTPKHNLALWNKFRVHRSANLGDFNVGLGIKAWSDVHGAWSGTADNATAPRGSGYGLVDLGFFWDKRLTAGSHVKVSINIANLFDKQYFERRRFPPGTVLYGDERRVLMSAQLAF